jgi:hypothetical protein
MAGTRIRLAIVAPRTGRPRGGEVDRIAHGMAARATQRPFFVSRQPRYCPHAIKVHRMKLFAAPLVLCVARQPLEL